jgi:subfamily B ATP-binding cassette protein MsbA
LAELRELMRFVRPYWRRMLLAGLDSGIGSSLSLAVPYAIRLLVDTIFVQHQGALLNQLALALLAAFVLQAVLVYAQAYLLTYVGQRVTADLRKGVYDRVVGLPLRFFSDRRVGELVSRVTNDITVLQTALTETPLNLLRQTFTLVGGLALMVAMNWRLTLIVAVVLPMIVAAASLFGQRLQRLSTTVQDRLADATAVLEETLAGVRVVKSFVQEDTERLRYARYVEAGFGTSMQRTRLRAAFVSLLTLLSSMVILGLLWFGGQQVISGAMTPGQLVAFLIYMVLVSGPIAELAATYSQVREALGAGKRIVELLHAEAEPLDDPQAEPLPRINGRVQFIDVCFSYEAGEIVLRDINLDVRPGEVVALVGHSGVGKTTLINLILRFYAPSSGRIEVDGRDIAHVRLRSLREQIGLVPQDIFLFGGTVGENIAFGFRDASHEQIMAAARAAQAEEFILKLPQGYDTLIGERGAKLSTGQRQRLAIAQALLRQPRILVLDEPTSALDAESEHAVQEALEQLLPGRTTFIIAHRLATVRRADRILVLEGGQIVEQGSHAELMALNGVYHRLYSLQFAERDGNQFSGPAARPSREAPGPSAAR